MVGQNELLNYFVDGAREMLNSADQNKHHVRKRTAILQEMTT